MGAVFILLTFAILSSISIAQDPLPKPGNLVVCYYTSWSYRRSPPYKFEPEFIDPFLCTHIIYAFAAFESNFDFDKSKDNFNVLQPRIVGLKERNPDLKILLSLSEWREEALDFRNVTKNEANRKKFSENSVKFLREYSFDGIDLSWQQPTVRDKDNYVSFAKALREEFENEASVSGKPRLQVTVSVTHWMRGLQAYDIRAFNKYVDFIGVLCYQYSFSLTTTAHHAPLYSPPDSQDKTLNVNHTINYFLERADPHKLVLGIPAYGRTWKLAFPDEKTGLGAEADGVGTAGAYTGEKGSLAYFEICSKIAKDKWRVVHTKPGGIVGPYAYKGDQWVSYDDADMVRTKTWYAKRRGLAGVMFWTVDYDDFMGSCEDERFPLINAAKRALAR